MAFSVRTGGFSPPPLDSLNFSVREGDAHENVRRNLSRLANDLGIDPRAIVLCNQVHGSAIEILDSVPAIRPTADALIVVAPGVFAAIRIADCLPILILDKVRRVCAAVHAGWKGALQGIVQLTLRMMKTRLGCRASDLVAALGPCIGPCCYEVDDRVAIPLLRRFSDNGFLYAADAPPRFAAHRDYSPGCVMPRTLHKPPRPVRNTYRLDLVQANRLLILAEGVPESNIYQLGLCTACHPDLFFSHRRDKGKTGRQIAVVGFVG
jgi:hypothetical protein